MNNPKKCKGAQNVFRNCITSTVLLASASLLGLAVLTCSTAAGALFTTDLECHKVNGNIYADKTDVYLNGGPGGTGSELDPNTAYCIFVTVPGGDVLNTKTCIVTTDADGHFPCFNLFECTGFGDTSNPGGEYTVQACPQQSGSCVSRPDTTCKSDNFKVRSSVVSCGDVCISCPENIDVPCTSVNGTCVEVTWADPIISPPAASLVGCTDQHGNAVKSGDCFPAGDTTTVTCVATDNSGNTASCFFTVTVETCPSCTLTCPLDQNPCNDSGLCSAVATYLAPECPAGEDVVVTCEPASGSAFPIGPNQVTCTAKQGDTVVDSCSFYINVKDCEAPNITCPSEPITKCNDTGGCTAAVTFNVSATDCDPNPTIVCKDQNGKEVKSGDSFPSGTTTVCCKATDSAGNSATCNFTITVNDCEKPTVTCPSPITVTADACGASACVKFSATALDNCDGPITPTCVPASGSRFNVGKTTVTCSATDKAGNTGTCSFCVTVNETTDSACGALTMGFWQNKNGGSIILGGASLSGVCKSGTWLRQFAPFQDLSATATCVQVSNYVYAVIKAANSSGTSMNPMLKGQMLASALDVYFSDASLGGNKINAKTPLGAVKIDLTKVCKMTDGSGGTGTCSGTTANASSAFGGSTCLTVLQMLTYAASQSNAGGTTWYGNVKTTQELAKNAFDAFNNGAAYICGP